MNMQPKTATLFAILAIALLCSCAQAVVTASGIGHSAAPLTGPFEVAPGSDAATVAELGKHGLVTEAAGAMMTVSRSVQNAKLGICSTPDASVPGGCVDWRKPPQTGWHPFGKPNDYRLVLAFNEVESGNEIYRVEAMLSTTGQPPADLTQQLVDAALACTGCTGGRVITPGK